MRMASRRALISTISQSSVEGLALTRQLGYDAPNCGQKFQVLGATDVASRGIHVTHGAHVINYGYAADSRGFHSSRRSCRTHGLGWPRLDPGFGGEIGELRSMERALKLKIARKHVNASVRTAARAIQKHAADTHAVAYARASTLVGSHCSDKPRRGARLLSIERLRLGNSSAAIAVRRYLCGPFSERASVPELASLAFSRPASGRRNGASHL